MAFAVVVALLGMVLWLGSVFAEGEAPRDVPRDEQVRPLEPGD
jgi:hypothetical protein